jgi:hypothetical protein
VFCFALVLCAIQNNCSRTFISFSFTPVNGILTFTNIQEEPAAYSSPISTEILPQFGQPVANGALWFSNLDLKSSLAVVNNDSAESKQSIIIVATYVAEPIFTGTVSESSENPFSCSA